ncbi:MAG: lipopolysaccharide biosynthesis protein [Ignavibacteriaceae bacterium]|nr:lipopolysaccharide biosynthesis protein [Ignavibacteria bacterium]NNL20404.1 lipopolysaccharide biosynthesis protein [Ignavibacteriaceae bacterium]
MKKINSKSLLYKSGIASIDQALLSGISFLISVVLIKTVSKPEYGYYSIFLSIILFTVSIQNAVINTPLAVLLITKRRDEKRKYAGALFFGQYLLLFPLTFIGIIGGILTYYFNLLEPSVSAIIVSISLASIGILCREFLRAYFFANETPNTVLTIDVLYFALITILGFLAYIFFQLDVAVIFLLMGLSSFLIGIFFIKRNKWNFSRSDIKSSYSENWQYGKWSLLGVTVTHIQAYSYLYLLGIIVSSVAVADVSAARLLLMPLVLAQAGWSKVILPHGSKLREKNRLTKLFKEQVIISVAFVVVTISFVFVLIFFKPVLLNIILSDKYANSFNYIFYWGAIFSMGFISLNANLGLQVLKNFEVISKVNSFTALLTILLAYFLISSNGIIGGLIALLIGGTVSAIILWYFYTRATFLKNQLTKSA